jgi:hypothetical protein
MENNCKCVYCGKEFHTKPSRIKIGKGRYCSQQCKWDAGYSPEIRKKMSESRKGTSSWNKGIPCSEEVKQKLRNRWLGTKLPQETKEKIRNALKGKNRGPNNGNWKGGIKRTGKYSYITTQNGMYISEHRYIMEKILNRKLNSDEVVHHINGRRDDNRIENLVVMNKVDHSYMHTKELHRKYNHKMS